MSSRLLPQETWRRWLLNPLVVVNNWQTQQIQILLKQYDFSPKPKNGDYFTVLVAITSHLSWYDDIFFFHKFILINCLPFSQWPANVILLRLKMMLIQ